MKRFLTDKRNQLVLLLSILFLIAIPPESTRFIFWIAGGVFLAVAFDTFINFFFLNKKIIPTSAIISGFITAGILNYHEPWFVLVVFSLLAIASKNIIRYKKLHIFNPANFALCIATLFKVPLTWNIESNFYLIIVFGIYIAFSLKKIYHILGFLIVFTSLFRTQGVNPFTLINWFFVFVMLIEPKTSGVGRIKGFIFGGIAGITSFLTFKFFPQYDFFVIALFIANLFNPALEAIKK